MGFIPHRSLLRTTHPHLDPHLHRIMFADEAWCHTKDAYGRAIILHGPLRPRSHAFTFLLSEPPV